MPRPRVKDEDRKRVARACDTCKASHSLHIGVLCCHSTHHPHSADDDVDLTSHSVGKKSATALIHVYYADAGAESLNAHSPKASQLVENATQQQQLPHRTRRRGMNPTSVIANQPHPMALETIQPTSPVILRSERSR